jgi:alanine racemase
MPRPLVASIDVNALAHTLAVARRLSPAEKVWAVVKANAYGHGLARAVRGFADADGLALIEPEAAVHLRELGWKKPILLLEGGFDADDYRLMAQYQLDTTIHCVEQLRLFEQAYFQTPINVYLKMNSGMNRLGLPEAEFRTAYRALQYHSAVASITLMTHFANADATAASLLTVEQQLQRFRAASVGIDAPCSVSNSAATLLRPSLRSEWIRPGIMLYGGTPTTQTAIDFNLQPAMTLHSELIGMQQITTGEAVGYGSRFIATAPMRVGVVACGYADGYPRHAPSGTPILVDGIRTRVIGNISMDMITVDLSPIPSAQVGSTVTLWGRGLPIDEVASAAGTIGYELMCAIASRVRITEQ